MASFVKYLHSFIGTGEASAFNRSVETAGELRQRQSATPTAQNIAQQPLIVSIGTNNEMV
jgi:hypothetical protein